VGPRTSVAGSSSRGCSCIHASYPAQVHGVRLQENFSQSSDAELFSANSHTQLFGLGRPASSSGGGSGAARSSNAAGRAADTSFDMVQYYR
jgi:hypothetical protein